MDKICSGGSKGLRGRKSEQIERLGGVETNGGAGVREGGGGSV